MLDGLDDIDWEALDGPVHDDVPALLRAIASDDAAEAAEALAELGVNVMHAGEVYQVTAAVIPFLVELATSAARHHRAGIIVGPGFFADREPDPAGGDEGVRAALAAAVPGITALLDDPDPEVRAGAAYTLAQAGDACPVPVLRGRLETEADPHVRASLLLAVGTRDPVAVTGLLRAAAVAASLPERIAAGVALHRTGTAWPDGAVEAFTEAYEAGTDAPALWCHRAGPWAEVVVDSLDGRLVTALVTRRLRSGTRGRSDTIGAVTSRCQARRSAPERYLPLLAPLLHDPDPGVRAAAVNAFHLCGRSGGRYADRLAAIADRDPVSPLELTAACTLARLGDPRWIDPLCRVWTGAAQAPHLLVPRLTPPVLTALAEALTADGPDPARLSDRALDQLLSIAERWGHRARSLAPALRTIADRAPRRIATTLVAIGAADAGELAEAAATGNLAAAIELCRRTGDAAAAVAELRRRIGAGYSSLAADLSAATAVGSALAALAPGCAALMTDPRGRRPVTAAAAHLYLLATGDAAAVTPLLPGLLDADATAASAELAAAIGDPAHELALRRRVARFQPDLVAARVLIGLGVPAEEFQGDLLRAIRQSWNPERELPLWLAVATPAAIPALRHLAERDERVMTGGEYTSTVWNDETLQDTLGRMIDVLSGE